ncbi:pentatricopeptide repeat-containing protein At3g46790, chloroplastic [Argentina anserina]|uniref:pentatricopeptide repeat-containing protein At3g46790, chloroplastic n=1 Tax=Argentina anserina TaxID=57926 RepID=UPI00217634BB|nr:pentatricopeptide repeat-containing protein At3g46790, chloroplastic [Potentilla anserina]
MASLAHALLGIPARCALCRALNPHLSPSRRFPISSISRPSSTTTTRARLAARSRLNAVNNLTTVHGASAPATVELPVTCYQLIGVPDEAEKDEVIKAVMDLKISEVEEGYTESAIESRQDLLRDVRDKLIIEPEYAANSDKSIRPNSALQIPWAWLAAALCLLLEVGEVELVLDIGQAAVKHPEAKPYIHDILLSIALAECATAKISFEQNKVSQGFEAITRAQSHLRSKKSFEKISLFSKIDRAKTMCECLISSELMNLKLEEAFTLFLLAEDNDAAVVEKLQRLDGNKNKLIQVLCKQGDLKLALQLFPHEPNPSQQACELLILLCIRHNSLSDGLDVHRHLVDGGWDQDPFLATKLIEMYSELDSIENAREVFDKTRKRTIYMWNALFRALTLAGHGTEVLNMYRQMNTIGVLSDRFTYTYVLKACVVSECLSSLLQKGKEIHGHILRHGYGAHVHVTTTLLDMYARFGCVSNACRVFDQMQNRNVVSWSAMIACYSKNARPYEALELFRKMILEAPDLLPNSVTMVSVLQACAALAALEQGKFIHGYILRRGLDSTLPVMSSLVTMYARCGKLELAQQVFNKIKRKDVVSWNSLISSYGIHGYGKRAIQIFEDMINHGVSPSYISFVSVLGACSHEGLVEEGKAIFQSMVKEHGLYPSIEQYACMVDLLGRANRLDEAAKIIEDMRIEPGAQVWGALLGSCRIHGNVELAERASKRLFELEPRNAGNYVLLADIYAEAKMWDEVKRVKQLLEAQELQKVPGRSWIEVNKKMYSFDSVDEFNPQMEQLHALLGELSIEMKGRGYKPQTKVVLYDLDEEEKERIVLGHSEKLAVAFGLINTRKGEIIRISKNLRLCEDCHYVTKFISKFTNREILVRDVNRFHHFQNGVCSCGDYW